MTPFCYLIKAGERPFLLPNKGRVGGVAVESTTFLSDEPYDASVSDSISIFIFVLVQFVALG